MAIVEIGPASEPRDGRPSRRDNHLLAALPDTEWQRWAPLLECIEMPPGKAIYESEATMTHVYFPTTAIVSLL